MTTRPPSKDPGWLWREFRVLCTAVQFLTRVPVPHDPDFDQAKLDASVRWFPWVGAAIGASGGAVAWAVDGHWPPMVVATLVTAWTAWLTSAFHEDGLADTFDALLGVTSRERALAIMKDSRIGSYGAVALVLLTLLRISALATLLHQGLAEAIAGLVTSHGLGRAAAVALMTRLPYAGDAAHAKAKPLARRVRLPDALLATGIGLGAFALPLESLHVAVAIAACLALVEAMRLWLRRRLGGYTGDSLGALEQMAEATVLLVLSAR